MPASKITTKAQKAQVVGTVHSPKSLQRALRLAPGSIDFLELRVDHFANDPRPLLQAIPRLKFPVIVTTRHPAEGGANGLSLSRRRALIMEFLPFAAAIDVELRTAPHVKTILAMARGHRIKVILSSHHFRTMPGPKALDALIRSAAMWQPDVFKIAALTSSAADLGRLISLFTRPASVPLSVMGMGEFGKISRLVLARLGSVLNYGYLDQPNASGQWEATALQKRLAEISDDEPSAEPIKPSLPTLPAKARA